MTFDGMPLTKRELKVRNLRKYGHPPSMELIESVVKKSGCKRVTTFQRVFNIPGEAIHQYKYGERGFPPIYWHLFYEFDKLKKFYSGIIKQVRRKSKKPIIVPEQNKSKIDEYRQHLAK